MADEKVADGKRPHYADALKAEIKRLESENAALRSRADGVGAAVSVVGEVQAAAPASADFGSFCREFLISLSVHHPELLSFDGMKAVNSQVSMAWVFLTDLLAKGDQYVAAARKTVELHAQQEADAIRDQEEERRKREAHRRSVRQGPVQVVRTTGAPIPEGLSPDEAAVLAAARRSGMGLAVDADAPVPG